MTSSFDDKQRAGSSPVLPSGPGEGLGSDRFLAMLAHELRNPLAPLRTAAELLGRPNIAEDTKERARAIIGRQVTQMARLIDELSDIARLGNGKIELRREPLGLDELLRTAADAARAALDERQVQLITEAPPQAVRVDADRVRLPQAIANLIGTAARRSEPGRRVWLRAVVDGAQVLIGVRDEGGGVDDAGLPGLFQLLSASAFGADAQGMPDEGFSVGLALAQRLVAAHGGQLRWRRDASSGGSEAALCVPLRQNNEG